MILNWVGLAAAAVFISWDGAALRQIAQWRQQMINNLYFVACGVRSEVKKGETLWLSEQQWYLF